TDRQGGDNHLGKRGEVPRIDGRKVGHLVRSGRAQGCPVFCMVLDARGTPAYSRHAGGGQAGGITSTELFRVRDTSESHLRNHSVYAIRPNHIYEIIPCTRYAQITSTESFRVRDTPKSHLRNHSMYALRPNHIHEITPRPPY